MVKLYKKGLSFEEIKRVYNCGATTVKRILKSKNIKFRSQGDARNKNSKYLDKNGYIYLTPKDSDKWLNSNTKSHKMLEQRLVMSKYLNRPLLKHETVHHKNGNRQDNRLSNLELWSKSQPSGQRVSDKIKWAQKLLKEYGYEVKKK